MYSRRWRGCVTGAGTAVLILAGRGCATFRGEPRAAIAPAEYDETTVLRAYTALNGDESRQRAYRNEVAYRWIAASDAEYDAFRQSLSREMKGVNVGSNFAVLLMNGVAVASGADAARALAAGSATVVGAEATLSRDAFLDQSLTTALTTAQASRTRRLTEIRRNLLAAGPSAYPSGDVLIDIRSLNAAASINVASAEMARVAAASLTDAQQEAATVVKISLVPDDVQAVRESFSTYVLSVTDPAVLDRLASVVGATKPDQAEVVERSAADQLRLYQQAVMDAYAQRAEGGAAAINALAPALKTITDREFVL